VVLFFPISELLDMPINRLPASEESVKCMSTRDSPAWVVPSDSLRGQSIRQRPFDRSIDHSDYGYLDHAEPEFPGVNYTPMI